MRPPDNDPPKYHHTVPRTDSPETKNTSTAPGLGGRPFRPEPTTRTFAGRAHVRPGSMQAEENRTSAWNHDGGEAVGRLGNQILGGHKLVLQPASPIPQTRIHVTVIDHYMNIHTPWFRNTQIPPHRLRILGNPRSKSIDLQIPKQPGQTILEAILLTLQIVGCQHGNMQIESEGM